LPMYIGNVKQCVAGLGESHPAAVILLEMLALLKETVDSDNQLDEKIRREKATFPERTLDFPTHRSLGKLDYGSTFLNFADVRDARGTVQVGAGMTARLDVSEEGAKDLSCLSGFGKNSLQRVDLTFTNVADGQIAHLKKLTGLRILILDGRNISDRCLVHLRELVNLETLEVTGFTSITRTGIDELKRFLPNCEIIIAL